MTSLATALTIGGSLLALAGLLGVAWAVFRARMTQTTIDLYRSDNEALRGRVDTLEGERDRNARRIAELEGAVGALREERAMLRDLATGASAVAELSDLATRQHAETVSLLRKLTDDRRTT